MIADLDPLVARAPVILAPLPPVVVGTCPDCGAESIAANVITLGPAIIFIECPACKVGSPATSWKFKTP